MSEQGSHSAAARSLREGLAAADRRRRAHDDAVRVWRAAPWAAGIALVAAAIARVGVWPALVPGIVMALGVVAFIADALLSRRRRPVTDAAAAAIDNVAGMGGELRSAGWFAERAPRDEWADFHLERAADKVGALNWAELYPGPHAGRARAITAGLIVAALALTVTVPEHVGAPPVASAAAAAAARKGRPDFQGPVTMLPPELQAQLEALLAAIERGDLPAAEALAQNSELRDALEKLSQVRDPKQLEALAKAMAATAQKPSAAQELAALADRARKAAESEAIPKDLQDALEKLADELTAAERSPDQKEGAESTASSKPQPGDAQGDKNAAAGMQDMKIQFAKQADAGGGAGVMMMSTPNADQSSGPPGAGIGGAGSQDTPGTPGPGIEAALKEELVQASEDTPGSNVETEIRRKTEHGDATVGYAGGAAATFDRSRAAAPPPVPEARRSGVQTYFIRK